MKLRIASSVFFYAATFAIPAIAETTIVDEWNLSGGAEKAIDGDTILNIHQDIDGVHTGKLHGSGVLSKLGDANLTLNGEIKLGKISIEEGTLTLGSEANLTQEGFLEITNTGTLVLAFSSGGETQLNVTDIDKRGSIVSTGTAQINNIAGNNLNVNAGTLVVKGATNFNEISVFDGATLQLGTGKTDSLPTLSGNISLGAESALIFNRARISGEEGSVFEYSGKISGEGDLFFEGSREVYFTRGTDQTYTGTTLINAGGMIFRRATKTIDGEEYWDPEAKAATLSSSEITVNRSGQFGGHVNVKGDVNIMGTEFSSVSNWESIIGKNTFGTWYAGAGMLLATGGDVLTIDGDLKIQKTDLEVYFPTETSYDYRGNSGGAMRIEFNAMGAGKIVANGNVELGGTLILVGANGIAPGQTSVFFESDPEKTKGMFDQIVYGSENVTLLLPGVGGIKENQYGIASVENRYLRKRKSFDEHVGLSRLVDYLTAEADGMNKIAQAISLASAGDVTHTVNNFSPLPYCALPEMAMRQSDAELEMILQNVARARSTPPESKDGVRVPANFSFFSGLVSDFVDHTSKNNTPVYDFDSLGVYAGGHTWLDDERMAGTSFGVHRSSAKPHGEGGTLDDIATRAKLFAVFAPKFSNWFLTIGGTFGLHYYDIDRETALGKNTGSTSGIDAGLFASLNFRSEIDKKLFFTPYVRLEYNFSYVSGIDESGSESRLDLHHFTTNTYRVRVGSGFEYLADEGKIFGVDFGLIGSFGGRPDLVSEFAEYDGSRTSVRGTVGERMSFEIAPRFSLLLKDDWTVDASYRVQCSFSGSISQSFGIGLSKQF